MSRKILAVFSLALIGCLVYAQEWRGTPHSTKHVIAFRDVLRSPAVPFLSRSPLSAEASLNAFRARGSSLTLLLPSSATRASRALAGKVEQLWNADSVQDALLAYDALCASVDPRLVEMSLSYPTGKRQDALARISANVALGSTADSVRMVGLATDEENGNLFSVTLVDQDHDGSIQSHWNMYASTDQGLTWAKTYSWGASYPINSISMAVVHHYCYVGFSRRADQTQVLVYRFSTTDGSQATFADSLSYDTVLVTTAPEAVQEVRMFSNHESLDNRLYCTALTSAGAIKSRWEVADSVTWFSLKQDVGGVLAGLTATYNYTANPVGGDYWISYVATAGVLCIDSSAASTFEHSALINGADEYSAPAIGAFKDTIFCASEMGGYVVYFIKYGTQGDWYWGYPPDTTLIAEQPAVAMARGDGIGLAYRYYTDPREARFTWRTNNTPAWSTPVRFNDVEEYYVPAAITSLGNGSYGAVYVSWDTTSYLQAFYATIGPLFTDVKQRVPVKPEVMALYQNYPNPFNPTTVISGQWTADSRIRLVVYDVLGQEVAVLADGRYPAGKYSFNFDGRNLASGIYFYRLTAGSTTAVRKMTLIR